ncbi:hypothetical protein BJV78DRAFT_1277689 [Lactifluus subvellereus]|nr:hypothetical protein BJV78DRAFT_1277689 [Lactifluus subvellereus]
MTPARTETLHSALDPYPVSPGISKSPISPPTVGYGVSSSPSAMPTELSFITTTFSAYGSVSAMSPGTPSSLQSSLSTITGTITETSDTTLATPAPITETTNSGVPVTTPPFITSIGLTTQPDGVVATMTQVIANPLQGASGSSSNSSRSFFGNHPVVFGVFLGSGMVIACIAALVFYCCRRRQWRTQRRGSRLPEISLPLPQNPFADPMGNRTMLESADFNARWDRFILPRNQTSTAQSSINVPFNRSEDSVPPTGNAVDTPIPSLPVPRSRRGSSYRVPVPYASLDAIDNYSRIAGQQDPDPFSEQQQMQAVQNVSPPDVPPRLPTRSPLRPLATKNDSKTPEDTRRLSRASSPSVYPPSLRSDGEVDSLYQREVVASSPLSSREASGWLTKGPAPGNDPSKEQMTEQASRPSPAARLSSVDSDGTHSFLQSASSSSPAQCSLLGSPGSEAGTALTSMLDEKAYRTLPRTQARAPSWFEHRIENSRPGVQGR